MLLRECCGPVPTPRAGGLAPVLSAVLLALAGPAAPQAILPPDAAVQAYQAGVDAAARKDWPTVVRRMDEALATGHREPKQNFGTTRNYVDLYDPWYWRGVALMELGDDEEARRDLVRSRDAGVIRKFPELSDLTARLATLDRRAEAARPAPTATPAPAPSPAATAALPSPTATPAPVRTETPGSGVERVLTLFAAGDLDGAEAALAGVQAARPDAREADLLQSLVLGTRYVLEGAADRELLARARRALRTWRDRGGPRPVEEALLSPSLLALLSGP